MKRLFLASLLAQLGAMLLSLWANLGVALGLHAESALQLDWFAPCAALFVAAWWSGRADKTWKSGLFTALVCVWFWILAHLYLTTRFSAAFLADAWTQLRWQHLLWWAFALLLGALGGLWGACFPSRRTGAALCAASLLMLWGVQGMAWIDSNFVDGAPFLGVNDEAGEDESFDPQPDGTTIHLLRFDLKRIRLGLYDADSDDSHPFDDQNATWLGQPLRRVEQKIAARDGKSPLCIVNGGFLATPIRGLGRTKRRCFKVANCITIRIFCNPTGQSRPRHWCGSEKKAC